MRPPSPTDASAARPREDEPCGQTRKQRSVLPGAHVQPSSLTLRVEDQTLTADAGAFACFPPGVAHTFLNASQAPVRVLNINAPGGWDRVLRSVVAASSDGELEQAEIGRIAAERDMIVLE